MATAKKTSTPKKAPSATQTALKTKAQAETKTQATANKAKAEAIQAQKPTTQQAVINTNTPKPTVSNPVMNAAAVPIKAQNAVSQVQQDVKTQATANKAKAEAIQAQKPTTQQVNTPNTPTISTPIASTIQVTDRNRSVITPTAEELAQWAIKGGRTDLQDNSYWSSQPDDVKQKAWAIIQGQNQANGTDPTTGQPVPTETADTSGTDTIFPSDQASNPQSYQDLLNAGQDRWDTFLDTQVSAYQKLQEDFSALMQTQVNNIAIDTKAMMDQLSKMQQSYDTERIASIARIQKSADDLNSIAKQEKDNATKANNLAAKESDSQYGLQIDMMRENNGRYMGYLQGKFEAAGMLDSSAGLQLLGKYMTSADMNMAYVTQDRVNVQQEFLNIGREIMTNYFNETYKAETTKNEQIAAVNSDMFDRIDKIQMDKLTTTAKKNELTLEAMKEGTVMQAEIQSKISQEVQAITQAKQQEAEFKFNVLQAIEGEYRYEKEFAEGQRQFDVSTEQWGQTFGLNYEKYLTEKDQWKQQFEQESIAQHIANLQNIQLLPTDLQTQFLSPSDVISGAEYVSADGTSTNMASLLQDVVTKVTSDPMGAAYQCVQFVRDVVKDLPTGLNSLQDKLDILVDSPNGTQFPEVGSVIVLDWKSKSDSGKNADDYPGHVALITAKDDKNRTISIAQFNKTKGTYSTETISMDDPNIKGYWKSDKVKTADNGSLTDNQKADLFKIKDDIRTEPAYKQIFELQSGYQNVVTGAKLDNAQGDLAIVNGMAKLLDPTGVVRPEEFKTVEEAQGVFQRLGVQFSKFMDGDRLTPEVRKQFSDAAQELFVTKSDTANTYLKGKYEKQANYLGLPIDSVLDEIDLYSNGADAVTNGYVEDIDLSQYGITN